MLRQAKLIRDTDKLDIMYLLGEEDTLKCRATKDYISDNVFAYIKKHTLVDRRFVTNKNEQIITNYAFAFDVNYPIIYNEYKKYFSDFHHLVKGPDQFQMIYDEVMKYINDILLKNS